jgi:lipopolysaccharide export system protein LptA
MAEAIMIPRRIPELIALLVAAVLPISVTALPDDDEQEIVSDLSDIEMDLNQGLTIFKGIADQPTCITQGTMKICGNEIRLERGQDGGLKKVTATGTPVRYQQQPEADKELAHLSGLTLVFDNVAQLLTVDGEAEFSHEGYTLTHQHIEYDLESGHVASSGGAAGGQGQLRIKPQSAPTDAN